MEIEGYNMPDELYYEENHYWVRKDGDILAMGMDDFAQKMAGEIVYVQLPFEGKKLKKGKKFAQVESGKWLGKVYAPVNGEIVTANQELEASATLIREDMEYMGPVRISDVEAAQQRIVDIVRRLEDAGEIIISGRGGAKEMIV